MRLRGRGAGIAAFVRRIAAARIDQLRYLVVGGLCFLLNWSVMLAMRGVSYVYSSALCFLLVGTLAYVLHATWTFRAPLSRTSLVLYLLGLAPTYPVSLAILFCLHDLVRVALWLAVPVTTAIMLAANFCVASFAIVRAPR